jgi:hypothetical protein
MRRACGGKHDGEAERELGRASVRRSRTLSVLPIPANPCAARLDQRHDDRSRDQIANTVYACGVRHAQPPGQMSRKVALQPFHALHHVNFLTMRVPQRRAMENASSDPPDQSAIVASAAGTWPQALDTTGISGSGAPGATTASALFNSRYTIAPLTG